MYPLFVILIDIVAILMIAIVLIQESKGGGLSAGFSTGNAVLGVRKTTDFIEKTTWGLAIALAILSVVCAHVVPTSSTEQSVIEKVATEQSQTNPNNLPGFGASQTKQNNTAAPAEKPAAAPAEQKAAN